MTAASSRPARRGGRRAMSDAARGDLRPLLAQVATGKSLSEGEAEVAFDIIMSGDATPSQLGPLSNPAGARRLLVGVFAPEWVRPMAEVLGRLGAERAWVVHGSGIDELTTTGVTRVAEFHNGGVIEFEVVPEEAGLSPARL